MGLRLQRSLPHSHPRSRRWQDLVGGAGEPVRRASDESLPKLNDDAVLSRAKALCAQNGAVWEPGDLDQAERWERNKIVVDGAGRQKYLALAREELLLESC
jgi:hypothetical protein